MLDFLRRLRRDRFAARIRRDIVGAGGPIDLAYDRDAFALKRENAVAHLENVYAAFCQARGAHRDQIVRNYVETFGHLAAKGETTWGEAQPILTAVVRERSFYAFSAEDLWGLPQSALTNQRPAFRPMSQWLCRGLVLDSPSSMAIVNESQLTGWGHSFEAAFDLGLARLRRHSRPQFVQTGSFFTSTWNDDYDSSRVLLPELLRDLPLQGAPVVVLPNRLTLLVTGAEHPDGVQAMLTKAEEICTQQPKPQNPAPLILRDGGFVDWDVDRSSPVFGAVQRARRFAALLAYSEQKQILDKAYENAGRDLFVASYTLTQDPAGDYVSYGVWTKGVATLLPKTDRVMFVDPDRPKSSQCVADVAWSRVVAVVAHRMDDTGMFPSRHHVAQFPTEKEFEGLRQG